MQKNLNSGHQIQATQRLPKSNKVYIPRVIDQVKVVPMMKNRIIKIAIILSVAVTVGGPAFAEKLDADGNSAKQRPSQENSASSPAHHRSEDSQVYFNEDRRTLIKNYYSKSQIPSNCPPGLAKKNNGCQPPGQIKKWRKGEPLPRDVVYYDLPVALIEELGRAPERNKIVQIDSNLLLIDIATGMVFDAFDVLE